MKRKAPEVGEEKEEEDDDNVLTFLNDCLFDASRYAGRPLKRRRVALHTERIAPPIDTTPPPELDDVDQRPEMVVVNENFKYWIVNFVFTTYQERRGATVSSTTTTTTSPKASYPVNITALCQRALAMGPQYKPKFAKIVIRIKGGGSYLIFKSGSTVETGGQNRAVSQIRSNYIVNCLRQCNMPDITVNRRICQNIVATGWLRFGICLTLLASEDFVEFNPKRFAGAIIRHPDIEKITLLAFSGSNETGSRVICVGAKSVEALTRAYHIIYAVLVRYRADDPAIVEKERLFIEKQNASASVATASAAPTATTDIISDIFSRSGDREPETIPAVDATRKEDGGGDRRSRPVPETVVVEEDPHQPFLLRKRRRTRRKTIILPTFL